MKKFPNNFGFGGIGLTDYLPAFIKAMLAPTIVVVAGAAANTDITVAGMTATSVVRSCIQYAAGVPSVVTGVVQANGKLQITTATTGNTVVVTFLP